MIIGIWKLICSCLKTWFFSLKISPWNLSCFSTIIKDKSWLWHLRYGNLNFHGLKLLYQKKMVIGLPLINHVVQLCEWCIFGKQCHDFFLEDKQEEPINYLELFMKIFAGQLIHFLLVGRNIFLLLLMIILKKTWIYFLQEKSIAFLVFQNFRSLIEKESCYFIKILRIDKGT